MFLITTVPIDYSMLGESSNLFTCILLWPLSQCLNVVYVTQRFVVIFFPYNFNLESILEQNKQNQGSILHCLINRQPLRYIYNNITTLSSSTSYNSNGNNFKSAIRKINFWGDSVAHTARVLQSWHIFWKFMVLNKFKSDQAKLISQDISVKPHAVVDLWWKIEVRNLSVISLVIIISEQVSLFETSDCVYL